MNEVLTPDGWGQVLRTNSTRGVTSHFVKGAGFEGWYDALQVTADFADHPDDVIPNYENSVALPYPSRPQGPGWDGTTSTIPPDVDPHIEMGHASDSLTGESTDEDPVGADLDGLFEPSSHLAGARPRRVHFAGLDDPILDISALPEESPTGLENSPINPDGVSTDDLFDGDNGFGRAASYDRLVIEDDLSFMRYAADDDEKKKHHHEQGPGYPKDDDSDDDSDDGDSDDSSSDGGDSSGGDSGGGGDGGGGHTAAALTTTADLHFLANFCVCAEELPLHSKSEHRELLAEGGLKNRRKKNSPLGSKPLTGQHDAEHGPKTSTEAGYNRGAKAVDDLTKPKRKGKRKLKVERPLKHGGTDVDGVNPQEQDLDKLLERYQQDNFHFQESNLRNLVDRSLDDGDSADLYNHYASVGKQSDTTEHKIRYDGGMPGIRSGKTTPAVATCSCGARAHGATRAKAKAGLTHKESSVEKFADGYDKYIGGSDGAFYLIASGNGKLPKGQHYGHYETYQDAHDAVEAIIARNHSKTAAPAQQDAGPTQIESQIEQLMQFWAVDNNGWWHWTGSQADLALLNQMQQQMMAVGMPGGPPGQMQAQSAFVVEENTPAPWREYLQTIASDRLVALAAWRDVVDKSKRLRAEGAIQVEVFKPEVITAYIQGDNGRYYTTVQRLGSVPGRGKQLTSAQVSGWSCECDWGHWAWLRKRSFVGRMCSHAYALFSEMRSLDAKSRKSKGAPGRFSSVTSKTAWARTADGGFEWVSNDPMMPTAVIAKTASGWEGHVWSDGTAEDSLSVGAFKHSEYARRAIARVVTAHVKLAEQGDVDMVGGPFEPFQSPDSIAGGYDIDPYSEDGNPEPLITEEGSPGIQESNTRVGFSVFAEAKDGDDDEGPEEEDDGIEEEAPDDDEDLDEEIAEDEGDSEDGQDEEGEEPEPDDDGGHDEPHKREDDDEDEGTDNPGDESDDDGIEKTSTVAELQQQYGLKHLAGADYSLAEQHKLVNEGDGKTARNRGDLNLTGTHYEAASAGSNDPEDTLAFLF